MYPPVIDNLTDADGAVSGPQRQRRGRQRLDTVR